MQLITYGDENTITWRTRRHRGKLTKNTTAPKMYAKDAHSHTYIHIYISTCCCMSVYKKSIKTLQNISTNLLCCRHRTSAHAHAHGVHPGVKQGQRLAAGDYVAADYVYLRVLGLDVTNLDTDRAVAFRCGGRRRGCREHTKRYMKMSMDCRQRTLVGSKEWKTLRCIVHGWSMCFLRTPRFFSPSCWKAVSIGFPPPAVSLTSLDMPLSTLLSTNPTHLLFYTSYFFYADRVQTCSICSVVSPFLSSITNTSTPASTSIAIRSCPKENKRRNQRGKRKTNQSESPTARQACERTVRGRTCTRKERQADIRHTNP